MTITNAIDSTAAAAVGSLPYISLDVCSVWFVPPVSKFFRTSNRYAKCIAGTAWNAYRMRVSAQENCYIYCIAFSGRTQQESSRGGIEKSSNRPVSYTHLDVYKRQAFTQSEIVALVL